MTGVHALAVTVAIGSLLFAVAMGIAAAILIGRRRRYEATQAARLEERRAASRHLLALSAGQAADGSAQITPDAERAALSQLLRLVRGHDRDKLLALAEREGLFEEAIAGLDDARPARRIDAMRRLEQFGSPECVTALTRCLTGDEDPEVRLEAATSLARLDMLPPLPDLIVALGLNERPILRLHAALLRSLARRDVEHLLAALGSATNPPLRRLLVEALGWTEDLTMASWLARFGHDPDSEVRCAAVRAARHLGHPDAGRWIAHLLDDEVEAVRVQASQAAGQLGVKAAIPALERLATEPAWWVRIRAREALEKLRPNGRATLSQVPAGV